MCIFCMHFPLIARLLQNDEHLYNSLELGFPKARFCNAKLLQKETLAWPDRAYYKLHL